MTAADADLKARITFAGELTDDDLMQAYADCDVFVLPSRYESFGLVLTEAMMFGKPVVATRAGGMAEIVEHGGNGYLTEPGDPAALADALRALLASADRRSAFGARSRALYRGEVFDRRDGREHDCRPPADDPDLAGPACGTAGRWRGRQGSSSRD